MISQFFRSKRARYLAVAITLLSTNGLLTPKPCVAGGPFGSFGGHMGGKLGGNVGGHGGIQVLQAKPQILNGAGIRHTRGLNLPIYHGASSRGQVLSMPAPNVQSAHGVQTIQASGKIHVIKIPPPNTSRPPQTHLSHPPHVAIPTNNYPGGGIRIFHGPTMLGPPAIGPNVIAPNLTAGSVFVAPHNQQPINAPYYPVDNPRDVVKTEKVRLPPKWANVPQETRKPAEVPKNDLAVLSAPPAQPSVPEPESNQLAVDVRWVSAGEMERALAYFGDNLNQLCDRLEERVPGVACDRSLMSAEFVRWDVPSQIQIQILDLINAGDCESAERIWRAILPKCRVPFHVCQSHQCIVKLRRCIADGLAVEVALKELLLVLPQEYQPVECCNADTLLAQLETEAQVYDVLVTAAGEVQLEDAETVRAAPLPVGQVEIIEHPGLPANDVLVVSQSLVMTGTGGFGGFSKRHGYAAAASGNAVVNAQPVSASEATLVRSGVLLINPTGAVVNLVADGKTAKLQPGERKVFAKEIVKVTFDQGTGSEVAKDYELTAGTYLFFTSTGKLDLGSRNYQVQLDNRDNATEFHYLVQGKAYSLAAGETADYQSNYPLLIQFDRGNGTAKQVLHERTNGTLRIAIHAKDNLWDLFPQQDVRSVAVETERVQAKETFVPAF